MSLCIRFSLALFAATLFTGCSANYIVSVRDSGTERPLADTRVDIVSLPRFYSFLDPRHYLLGCGRITKVRGRTDPNGQVKLSLPQGPVGWHVIMNDSWTVSQLPEEWTVMLRRDEFQSRVEPPNIGTDTERPEIKVLRE